MPQSILCNDPMNCGLPTYIDWPIKSETPVRRSRKSLHFANRCNGAQTCVRVILDTDVHIAGKQIRSGIVPLADADRNGGRI
jgi:hypothetical protein